MSRSAELVSTSGKVSVFPLYPLCFTLSVLFEISPNSIWSEVRIPTVYLWIFTAVLVTEEIH